MIDKLFLEGLKQENNGHFEEAIMNYENALDEMKKKKYDRHLGDKIIQKLTILNTIVEYKKSLRFTRQQSNGGA